MSSLVLSLGQMFSTFLGQLDAGWAAGRSRELGRQYILMSMLNTVKTVTSDAV